MRLRLRLIDPRSNLSGHLDVLVECAPGTAFGVMRGRLAALMVDASDGFEVDGLLVSDDAEVGIAPLLHGAALTARANGFTSGRLPGRTIALLELHVVGGLGAGRRIPLGRGDHVLGRAPHCAIRLDDAGVSRSHATLTVGRGVPGGGRQDPARLHHPGAAATGDNTGAGHAGRRQAATAPTAAVRLDSAPSRRRVPHTAHAIRSSPDAVARVADAARTLRCTGPRAAFAGHAALRPDVAGDAARAVVERSPSRPHVVPPAARRPRGGRGGRRAPARERGGEGREESTSRAPRPRRGGDGGPPA